MALVKEGYSSKMAHINPDTMNLQEVVVKTNRVQKTHKGGRTMSFNSLVVVGDGEGHVGAGVGKARAVPDAIRKGAEDAKKRMIEVPIIGHTIPHEITAHHGSSIVLLKPAAPGTGVVAGTSCRSILVAAGVKDVLAKCLGSTNAINVAWATIKALQALKTIEGTAAMRGKDAKKLIPWARKFDTTAPVVTESTEADNE